MSPAHRSFSTLLGPLLLASALGAQATVFEGTPGGVGNVLVFPAPGAVHARPAELQGITLLPIDATGRSEFLRFRADQPRRKADVPGASRLVMPQGQGSLYRYRRDTPAGVEFGFFVVPPSGQARKLISFPGTGPQGTIDPIPNPIGVAADGLAFLAATTVDAGGDVYEVRLDGTVVPITATLPPQQLQPHGLILLPTFGAALTSNGPLRFARGPSRPVLLPLRPRAGAGLGQNPGAPARAPRMNFFGDGFVASGDNSTIGVVAGTDAANACVYTFRASGDAVCVNDLPAPILGPGFATESGPNLALSPDGRRAAWKTQDALGGECFSREVPVAPTPPEVHITGDANFTDTLNDTGVLAFFDPDSVVLIVGEPNGAGGIENGDFYRAKFPVGGGAMQLTNLTNTSGDALAPFDAKGDLETADGIYQIPGELGSVFFVPGSSGRGFLMRLDAVSGSVDVLRDGVDQLEFLERAGPGFVAGILLDRPAQRELVYVPFDHNLPATSLKFLPTSTTFGTSIGNAQGLFGSVLNVGGGQQLGRQQLPGGPSMVQSTTPQAYGPTLGFDPLGNLLATVQVAGSTFHLSWLPSGKSAPYLTNGGPGMILPAN